MDFREFARFLGQLAVWFELRVETRQHMAAMDRMILFVAVVMILLVAASRYDRFRDAIVLAALMGAFFPFLLARQDLLIHRPAPAVKAIEHSLSTDTGSMKPGYFKGWENHFKPQMKPLTNLLPVLDVLMAAPIIFLFWYSTRHASNYLNSDLFWWGCWAAFLIGCGMFWLVMNRAGQLMSTVR